MTTNSNIKLVNDDDWVTWYKTLKIKAKHQGLWEYLDPEKTNKPPMISVPPMPPDITLLRPSRHGVTTRAGSTTTPSSITQGTGTLGVVPSDDDSANREETDPAISLEQINEMSDKSLRSYNTLWSNYGHLLKRHENFQKKVDTIQNWVMETVDDPLGRHHCSPDHDLADWIKSLYDEFRVSQFDRTQKAQREYREILEKPRQSRLNTYKATGEWIAQWRNAINEARDVDLQEAKLATLWFNELTITLRATPLESWVNAYSVTQVNRVRDNTLTVAEAVADIRRVITNQPEPRKRAKVTHGAFLSAEGAESSDEAEGPRERKRGNHPTGKKRRSQSVGDDKEGKCPACNLSHPLAKCYYAFPEKRPQYFRLSAKITERVKKRIEENKDNLADRIKKIKMDDDAYPLQDSVLLDSGATLHIFRDASRMKTLRAAPPGEFFWSGTTQVTINGYGDAVITLKSPDGSPRRLKLYDVALCTSLTTNLVSFSKLRKRGLWWDTRPGNNCLRRADGSHLGEVEETHGQQVLEYREASQSKPCTQAALITDRVPATRRRNRYTSWTRRRALKGDSLTWHRRLGHPGPEALRYLGSASRGVRLKLDEPQGPQRTTTVIWRNGG
ncbi:hypothetical protein MRS44_018660 [Fusarium solani]|uniref:uncharacterized protein n=1 Tax=Fusarium solani TaxID=169388 RepID=UPI0032C451AB|nr:hypothetical protein MRS44_018660 [Fusarium solani]